MRFPEWIFGLRHSLSIEGSSSTINIVINLHLVYRPQIRSVGREHLLSSTLMATVAEPPTLRSSCSTRGSLKLRYSQGEISIMKEPGLDNRHRDKAPPKVGQIEQKHGDTLNKNLPRPIPQFSPNAKLSTMRKATGKVSEDAVRRAAKILRPDK